MSKQQFQRLIQDVFEKLTMLTIDDAGRRVHTTEALACEKCKKNMLHII